jgi:uncharacterized protein YfdQ (DUF2303 family)
MNVNGRTDTDAIIEAARRSGEPRTIDIEHDGIKAPVLLVPMSNGGYDLLSVKDVLDEYRAAPERRKGKAILGDIASFIDHTNRFKDDGSTIFASPDPAKPWLMTVFDYHYSNAAKEGADPEHTGQPRFLQHQSVYNFPISEEWKGWKEAHGKPMTQAAFAEFIENRILDVIEPNTDLGDSAAEFARKLGNIEFATPMKLLELSRGLSVRVGAAVKQAVNLSTGEVQIQYETQHQDERGAPLKVPTAFLIAIPVFRSGVLYQVPVRLRYSVRQGEISWRVELHKAEMMAEDAFNDVKLHATKETALPLFVGTPENC